MKSRVALIFALLVGMATSARAQIPGGAFTNFRVDRNPSVGLTTSIAIGLDGLGLISYCDATNGDLKVAHCADPACSMPSVPPTTLDGADNVGNDTSITIGTDGFGLVSYFDNTNSALKVAHCLNTACTAATTATLDSEGNVGQTSSIVIGSDGLALISYYGVVLKVAHCSDTACTSASTATIDAGLFAGLHTSIAIGTDGLGLVSYYDGLNGNLKVAHCSNTRCTSATTATLDFPGDVGEYTSVAIGADGLGLISYWDRTNSALKAAHCSNTACNSATLSTVDDSGDVGWHSSIAIGADGMGLISYTDFTTFRLKVAHCSNTACTAATTTAATTTSPETFGAFSSIAIGADGLALISYCGGCRNLYVAHQAPRGDFNRDGRPDLVWSHAASGQSVVWYMSGFERISGTFTNPASASTNWQLAGTDDFNGDAQMDLLWRHVNSGENAVWFMAGINRISGTLTTPSALPDVNWRVGGTGDFNGDGKPDILWRHQISGQNLVWFMDGTVMTSNTFTTPATMPDMDWNIAGTGDFNRDGRTDILWHHEATGQIFIWYMSGSVMTSSTFADPTAVPNLAWKIVAVGDYNVDGWPDIVWRHQASGQNAIWFMDNASLVSGVFTNPSAVSDLNWKLVGPR